MHDPVFLRRAWLSLPLFLLLPLTVEASGLDLWLEDFYFDSATHSFPWRYVWWFNAFLHDGLCTLLLGAVIGVGALLLAAWLMPQHLEPYLAPHWYRPRMLGYLLTAMLAGPVIVALLKEVTTRPCPWNLALYGGHIPYASLLAAPLFDWHAPGKCFPGAHASGGFGLLAFVPLLAGRRRLQVLGVALLLGLGMGWTRMMQGAHFLSHNLWSAWICWAAVLLSYAIFQPGERRPAEMRALE